MDPVAFEEMCCAILQTHPHIESAVRYGVNGQSQKGIDILAKHKAEGHDVAQCKCHKSFDEKKIDSAVSEFLKHVGFWKDYGTKTFILLVASSLSNTPKQDKIKKYIDLLEKTHKIQFTAWDGSTIQNKLRPHRGIVFQYLGKSPEIVDLICGPAPTPPAPSDIAPSVVSQSFDIPPSIRASLNAAALKDLEEVIRLYTKGKTRAGLAMLLDFKKDVAQWALLNEETKAKFLRIEAHLRLRAEKDLATAKKLADEADALHTAVGSSLLSALLCYEENGAQAALDYLGDASASKILLLRASLLMALDDYEQASALLERAPKDGEDKDEALRLTAYVRLHEGKIESAIRLIDQAHDVNKDAYVIRFAQGVLRYYSALSPIATPKQVMAIPEPIDWMLVRRDDQSRARLREAATMFEKLLERCETDQEQRRHLEGWRLACLACNTDTISEAEEYCRALLAKDRTHDQAIAWGLSRGLAPTNMLSKSIAPLQELVEDAPTLEAIISLCMLYLYLGQQENAASLAQSERERFEKAGQLPLWEAWTMLTQDAAAAAAPAAYHSEPVKLAALLQDAKTSKDMNSLRSLAITILTENRSQQLLPDICVLLARNNQWTFLADNADALIEQIGTDAIVEMAAMACANIGRYEDVLRLLDAHKDKFPRGMLPIYLQRAYHEAQFQAGDVREALLGMERIAQQTNKLGDLLAVAGMYWRKGDVANAMMTVKRAKREHAIPPEHSLRFASAFAAYDQEVAKELVLDAKEKGIPQEYLSHANNMLSLRLGIEKETESVTRKFYKKANEGEVYGVQRVTLDVFRSMMRARSEQAQNLEKMHNAGAIPIHLAVDALNGKLVTYYHQMPTSNASIDEFQRKTPLLYRHGGLRHLDAFPARASDIHLHVDISSLLLANHLGILGEVEKLFKPLYIAQELVACLQDMCAEAGPVQPSWAKAADALLGLVAERKIKVLAEGDAAPTPSTVLDWTEHAKQALAVSPEPQCNCRALADSLLALGAISTVTHADALAALGVEAELLANATLLQRNADVFCKDNTAKSLAAAGLLTAACETFTMYVTAESVEWLRRESLQNKERRDVALWLKDLLDRVSDGITLGDYEFFVPQDQRQHSGERPEGRGPAAGTLEALVSVACVSSTVLWCDDRCINSYKAANGYQIACVTDILQSLRRDGVINEARYFERMQYLRKVNARFMPLTAEELLYHLCNAPIVGSVLQETPELSLLRRYYASCFTGVPPLQLQEMPDHVRGEVGEIRFVDQHHKGIARAVAGLWKRKDIATPEKISRANWVMRNMYIEQYPELHSGNREFFPAMFHASFLSQGFELCGYSGDNTTERCSAYVSWYTESVLAERLRVTRGLDKEIAQFLVNFVFEQTPDETAILGESADDVKRAILENTFKKMKRAFLSCLPKSVKQEAEAHDCVCTLLSGALRHTLSLGAFEFDFATFAEKAAKALSGEAATITSNEGTSNLLEAEPSSDGNTIALRMTPFNGEEIVRVNSPINCVFHPDAAQRAACLMAYSRDFDRSKEQLRDMASAIAEEPSASIRFANARSISLDSCVARYSLLSIKLHGEEDLTLDDILPPSADALARYLRLAPDDPDGEAFELAAERLLSDVGMAETLRRFSGLPRPFPAVIIQALEAMSEADRAACIAEWAAYPNYPLFVLHYVRLALQFQSDDNDTPAGLIEHQLCHEGFARAMDIFKALLDWSSSIICSFPETSGWPYWMRLALSWSHASQLAGLLLRRGVPVEEFSSFLSAHSRGVPLQDLLHEAAHGRDVASPRAFNATNFTLAGLTYALEPKNGGVLTTKAKEALREIAFIDVERALLPGPEFINDLTLGGDCLGSFLRQGLDAIIDTLDFDDLNAADWSSDSRSKEYVEQIESTDLGLEAKTLHLMFAMSHATAPDACRDALISWLASLDFVEMLKTNDRLAFASLIWASRIAGKYNDAALSSHIELTARTIAQEKMTLYESGLPIEKWAFLIFEPVFWLALGAGELDAYIQRLMHLLDTLIETNHDLIPHALTILERHVKQLPYESTKELWKMIVRLRRFPIQTGICL